MTYCSSATDDKSEATCKHYRADPADFIVSRVLRANINPIDGGYRCAYPCRVSVTRACPGGVPNGGVSTPRRRGGGGGGECCLPPTSPCAATRDLLLRPQAQFTRGCTSSHVRRPGGARVRSGHASPPVNVLVRLDERYPASHRRKHRPRTKLQHHLRSPTPPYPSCRHSI